MVLNFHIIHIIEQWFPQVGGSEIHCLNLSKYLIKNGFKITLITRNIIKNRMRFKNKIELFDGKLTIYRVGIPSHFDNNFGRLLFIPFSIYRAIRIKKIDLIHCHTFTAGLSGIILKILKKPTILTIHAYHSSNWFKTNSFFSAIFYYFFEKIIIFHNFFNSIISVSYKIYKQIYNRTLENKLTYIPNGVDLSKFDSISKSAQNKPYILFIGRLENVKGIFYLLDAFLEITKIDKDIYLKIIGEGKLKKEINKYIIKNKLKSRIHLLGKITGNKLIHLYKNAKMLVIPSINEGLPLVILEGWASKIPIIATNVGDIPKYLKNNINGILIPPKNSIILYEKIKLLLNNDYLCKKLVENGYNLVKNKFSWDRITKDTINIYRKVLKK
ncbi:MAG: glycosyltransferase family 4 protein [Candidatus Helarchaeota archaeon]